MYRAGSDMSFGQKKRVNKSQNNCLCVAPLSVEQMLFCTWLLSFARIRLICRLRDITRIIQEKHARTNATHSPFATPSINAINIYEQKTWSNRNGEGALREVH